MFKTLLNYFELILNYIYKHRFLFCILLFAILVLFKLHGSSIGLFNEEVQSGSNISKYAQPLIGKNRMVRFDEWALHTPMALSQKYQNYSLENSLWADMPMNMALVYAQPIKEFFSVIKPFHWGYLLFDDNEYGLSWYWCGRMIFLFLVTFEFFKIITRKNKLLSLMGAFMVVYSPGLQWFFAVNDFVEQIFWSELGIISLYYFFRTKKHYIKFILSILLGCCISGFLTSFYPAWQIPFVYVFGVIALWVCFSSWKDYEKSKFDVFYPILSLIIASVFCFSMLFPSLDVINIIQNTSYPGKRYDFGGGEFNVLFFYLLNNFIYNFVNNQSELSHFIGFFPLPAIIAFVYLFKTNFKDKLILSLLCIELFFVCFLVFGFSEMLARYTGLIYTTFRVVMITSFIDVLLLIRLLSNDEQITFNKKYLLSGLYVLICAGGLYLNNMKAQEDWILLVATVYSIVLLVILFFVSNFLISAIEKKAKYRIVVSVVAIVFSFVFFSLVNPVVKGLDTVYKIPVGEQIAKLQKEDAGKWLVIGTAPETNFPVIFGAPTVNSTNIYPNLEFFEKFDEDKIYKDFYNRFGHVVVLPSDNGKTYFDLYKTQFVVLYFSLKDFHKFGVKYIFTTEISDMNIDLPNLKIKKIYDNNGAYIYKVKNAS